ncbi:MAG: HAD hydrolase-like protein [Lachnospiraceae bacterium]|nr:HAD hydrolase-like protein [Lachnospiraceae bacterium]
MKKYILFDLDGTISDSAEGITKSVQYALSKVGIEENDLDKLKVFIGPPITESFPEFYGLNEEQTTEAVKYYRERYNETGKYENKLYDGMALMLKRLKDNGFHLAVASGKPRAFCRDILDYFHITQYFEVISGSEPDGSLLKKEDIINDALNKLFHYKPIRKEEVYMVGDRKFDVEGAKRAGVECVGVTYGFGSLEELKEAKADYIVTDVQKLSEFLMREAEEAADKPVSEKEKSFSPSKKIWLVAFPILMFLVIRQIAVIMFMLFAQSILPAGLQSAVFEFNEAGEPSALTGNATVIIYALSYMVAGIVTFPRARVAITKTEKSDRLLHIKKDSKLSVTLFVITLITGVIGINMLFETTGLKAASEGYQTVSMTQYGAAFPIGLICFGLVTPVCEELLFRGVVYNYIKKMGRISFAVLISAFLFGTYHGNAIQSVYGFLFGLLFAYGYEYYGKFYVPVLLHIGANILAYSLSRIFPEGSAFVNLPVAIVFTAIALISAVFLYRTKKVI